LETVETRVLLRSIKRAAHEAANFEVKVLSSGRIRFDVVISIYGSVMIR